MLLELTPLVGIATRGVPDSLNVRRGAWFELLGNLDRLRLGGRRSARPLRTGPPDRVIALTRAFFNVDSFISHSSSRIFQSAPKINGEARTRLPPCGQITPF